MSVNFVPPKLDENARRLIDESTARASVETPESIRARTLAGTESTRGLLGNKDIWNQSEAKFGGENDERVLAAINARSSKKYDSALSDLGIKAKHQGINSSIDRKAKAASLIAKEQRYNSQREAMLKQIENDKKAARGAVLGNVLGIAGAAVAGIYSGGNPAAMGAGMAIGQGVGQSIGGS